MNTDDSDFAAGPLRVARIIGLNSCLQKGKTWFPFAFPNPCVYTLLYRYKEESDMQKLLIKHGNSLALVIDKPILDLLHISADTPLEVSTNGDQLLVTPCRDKSRQKKIDASLEKINSKFAEDLKRLAQ
jgi:antitoxin MazE